MSLHFNRDPINNTICGKLKIINRPKSTNLFNNQRKTFSIPKKNKNLINFNSSIKNLKGNMNIALDHYFNLRSLNNKIKKINNRESKMNNLYSNILNSKFKKIKKTVKNNIKKIKI